MFTSTLRLLIAIWVLFMLGRAGVGAWRQRALIGAIWRRIGAREVLGASVLLVLVGVTAIGLLTLVPWTGYGLGSLVGFAGNAVFVPLEEAAGMAGPPPTSGPDWVLIGGASVFLGALALLLPWLAFIEEEVFRAGLEDASPARELGTALVFGLAHLVMLVPLAAALAVGVAGVVYGRVYRRAFRRSTADAAPPPVLRAFRPTKRSAAAADRARTAAPAGVGLLEVLDRSPERRQASAVLASTALHTAFNTLVVALVWAGIVWEAWG